MDDSTLTLQEKAEIRRYLLKLILPTGGIAGVFLLGLGWAVNELGVGLAYNKAFEDAQSFIFDVTRKVSDAVAETERARIAIIDNQVAIEAARKEAEDASEEAMRIKGDLDIAKISKIVEDAAKELSNNGNFVNAVASKTNADLTSITAKLNAADKKWGVAKGEHGYGFEAWKHQDKSVHCPEGSYVTGIRVRYSGTCERQCNADGGIVREILLECRSVFH